MAVRGGKFLQRSGKMAAMMARNEEDDDDDDDSSDVSEILSDEEEEEEEESKGQPPAKKRRTNTFFDEEAEASGDEDEDEDDDEDADPHDVVKKHYTEEDIRREQMDEEAKELIRQQDRRRAQSGGNRFVDSSVADVARDIEDRHRMSRRTVNLDAGGADADDSYGDANYTAVSQQSLVPSVSDPSLWMISCSNGKEEELVFQIMNKCVAYARQNKPLGITAAIAAQSKGKIYVESYSEPSVVEAIQNIRGLMQYSMRLVPIHDMTTVMTVTTKKKPVKEHELVRMTRGHYKGDLAQVKFVRESGLKAVVQCVPRLDLTLSDLPPEEAKIRRRTVRPPQKYFNAQELAALGKTSVIRQRFPNTDLFCDYFEGNYYHDGFLLKEVTVGSMIKEITDDPPTIDELQQLKGRNTGKGGQYDDDHQKKDNEGENARASLLDELSEMQGRAGLDKPTSSGLLIGDTVEVIEGDLVGMRGKLISLDGTTVKVKPTSTTVDLGGTQEVEFLASQVRKFIQVGAHVKITDGRYANETGGVVAVDEIEGETDHIAIVLTDVTSKEITVRVSQLRETTEINSGQDRLAGYELYDLVSLSGGGSANEVGIIVRVGREDFTVINNHGIVREVRPEELRGKQNTRSSRAIAGDAQTNQLKCGDLVRVLEGPHKGKEATIKRISRTQLFLFSQARSEHAGIFVVRARSCVQAGTQHQNRGSAVDAGASPFSTPRSQGPVGGRGATRDDGLIGKTVRIQAGNWKGYLGTVCDATPQHVQVELHSRLKKVMVVRERVVVAGDKFGATDNADRTIMDVPGAIVAPTTPFVAGGATPMHGGATPLHGGATPMHDSMGGDEVWRPGGSIDQDAGPAAESNDNDGWGQSATSEEQNNPFGSPSSEADSGWGASTTSSTNNTWAPEPDDPTKQQESAAVSAPPIQPDAKIAEADVGDADEATPVWFMERVCVQLKSDGSTAVVKDVAGNSATVEMEGDKSNKSVRASEVSMVEPKEHDQVLVTSGAEVGVEGELVCIDGTDAILKDPNEEFRIVDYVNLAKIVTE
jgi:transcription elongation factor SPT5